MKWWRRKIQWQRRKRPSTETRPSESLQLQLLWSVTTTPLLKVVAFLSQSVAALTLVLVPACMVALPPQLACTAALPSQLACLEALGRPLALLSLLLLANVASSCFDRSKCA
jgi:hypothetical protein